MSSVHHLLPRTRAARHAWLWWLAALLVLKAAVPLLAAAAAAHQGVSLAQVCTVYGVRTVAVAAAMPADHVHAHPESDGNPLPEHAAGQHCALASLSGGPLSAALSAVLAHAPPQALRHRAQAPAVLPADAAMRWLFARLHSPPPRG